APLGSTTVIVPSPEAPPGAFANQGRPNPLLSEMPRGRLTLGRSLVTVTGATLPFTLFRNASLCAAYRTTAPPTALACPPAAAKPAGTAIGPALTSIDKIDPSGCPSKACGAPKFDVLATRSRVRSSTWPDRKSTRLNSSHGSISYA